jgi:hypothetical protein
MIETTVEERLFRSGVGRIGIVPPFRACRAEARSTFEPATNAAMNGRSSTAVSLRIVPMKLSGPAFLDTP